ncbi:hypothetical protein Drorol1_Dr00012904 [Drosera rotundifolia]
MFLMMQNPILGLPIIANPSNANVYVSNSNIFSVSLSSQPMTMPSLGAKPIEENNLVLLGKGEKRRLSVIVCCGPRKIIRDPVLDKQVTKQNSVRFVRKLVTLLLSKPKHFMRLSVLAKCRAYLSLPRPRSILEMIQRYPTVFELFTIPYPRTPLYAARTDSQLCVRLTPAMESLAAQEAEFRSSRSVGLAHKLQKLLMMSSHKRLVLSKLVHLGTDLGLPPNFRQRLCNEYPERFKTVDTSYGRALELVAWDDSLENPFPKIVAKKRDLIVDRPLKFKQVKLRKGMSVKRPHLAFLNKFEELPDICPYKTPVGEFPKESIEAEKRACAVVREVLGMTLEKRTIIDHLTSFRKEFGLPNKLRGMLIRHPELFYVSLRGQRDSVFLVEAYDDNGTLIETDDALRIKNGLFSLVSEGKRIKRERKRAAVYGITSSSYSEVHHAVDDLEEEEDDGLDHLFDEDEPELETHDDDEDEALVMDERIFWTAVATSTHDGENGSSPKPW